MFSLGTKVRVFDLVRSTCHAIDGPLAASLGNVERFRGGLVLKAHRLVFHSTLGSRVIKKRRENLA